MPELIVNVAKHAGTWRARAIERFSGRQIAIYEQVPDPSENAVLEQVKADFGQYAITVAYPDGRP